MSKFDVRNATQDEINTIIFADTHPTYAICNRIEKEKGDLVKIVDEQYGTMYIGSKEDALNLIKALNKAIELGWFDTE